MNICKLKRSTQIAIMTGAGSGAVEKTASGTAPLMLSDSVAGNIHSITIKGHSEKSKNLFNETYPGLSIYTVTYKPLYLGNGTYTMSTTTPQNQDNAANLFFIAGNVSTGGSTAINGVWNGQPRTVTTTDGYVTIAYRLSGPYDTADPNNYHTQIEVGTTVTSYEPYGIKSIGDNGLTITTANSDSTETSTATITTGLPLRSVSDSIYDTLDNDKVTKKCAEVDLGDLTWAYNSEYQFFATTQAVPYAPTPIANGYDAVCSDYQITHLTATTMPDKTILVFSTNQSTTVSGLVVKDTNYTDASTFKTAMSGVKLVYPLAEPTETPLTDAEITAFLGLKTFDPTTTISVTDNPSITVKYMGKRTTRTAPKKRTKKRTINNKKS